jgi:hypothetical protein
MPRNAIVGARKTYLKAAGRTTKYSSAGAVFLTMPETSAGAAPKGSTKSTLPALSLAALSIVFGDIGASPLNTFKTVLDLTGAKPEAGAILGSLSLILWTLIIVTSVKYVGFATRVDNDGEGGILALMSLLGVKKQNRPAIRGDWTVRRSLDLWRWGDHAGDIGAVGANGARLAGRGAARFAR